MNAAAANALYEAERKGVRQIKGRTRSIDGRCAVGVLEDAGVALLAVDEIRGRECPACGQRPPHGLAKLNTIAHLNDDHGLSFSEIARKLGPDSL